MRVCIMYIPRYSNLVALFMLRVHLTFILFLRLQIISSLIFVFFIFFFSILYFNGYNI